MRIPSKYADIADCDFTDIVGFNCPVDKKHVHAAIRYWQNISNRHFCKDLKARSFIAKRIVKAALKFNIAISYDGEDPDYVKRPESLNKQMQGYEAKRSQLEAHDSFGALQISLYVDQGKQFPAI